MTHSPETLLHNHELGFTFLAVLVLIIGAAITMRIFARVRRSDKSIRWLWLFLAGLAGGGTIWSTHFLSMIAFKIGIPIEYDIMLSITSLMVAIGAVVTGFVVAASTQRSALIEVGGFIIGMGIVCMHFTGIEAMEMAATISWSKPLVTLSIVSGGFFGAIATNRVARPVTRFCKHGGTLSFILAVATMHYIAMGAMQIIPNPSVADVVGNAIPDAHLGLSIFGVMFLLISTTAAAYWIDIKNSQESTQRMQHIALHDPLTGLANRMRTEEHLHDLINSDLDDTARIAVVAIDLDRFKEINDVHGQSKGDAILKALAERLSGSLLDGEFVARFGGDEFVAIKYPIYMDRQTTGFCSRVKDLIEEPIIVDGMTFTLSASIGFASYPEAGKDAHELLHRAALATYQAKIEGRNRILEFQEGFDEDSRTRGSFAMDLKNAIKNDELELHFQLQNDANTREVIGAEALLRWNHPEKGRVPPDIFIKIAEETGSIVDIGDWVLRTACQEAARWNMPYTVAVNVASQQLADAAFPAKVEDALKTSGLDPARLELEITETGIIADISFALSVLKELKALGVKVAMDDYGTGYSSLSTLQSFPFDKIKIDREFVTQLPDSKQSTAIVKATVILGTSLDIPVLAEGVETEEQLEFLAKEGCVSVQGYLFGKPMPADSMLDIAVNHGVRVLDEMVDDAGSNVTRLKRTA